MTGRRLPAWPLGIAGVVACAGAVAWFAAGRTRSPERPPLIVYLIDTMRVDRLGCYGDPGARTPVMDRLARTGILFDRAYSASSWTRPAVGSVLTGLYPSEHGAVGRENRLRDVTTLPEILGAAGYTTAAFVSNPNVLPVFGFGRGFDTFVDVESVRRSATADRVHQEVFRYLAEPREGPLFLYVHTRDPHAPYTPPPPYERMFPAAPDTAGPARARYDGEIAFADRELGVFLGTLEEHGRFGDGSLLVLLSDHGEEFLDHGGAFHGKTLFEEQIHVPLIVRLPGRRRSGVLETRPVRTMDLMPSLCALLKLDVPSGVQGRPFLGKRPASGPDGAIFSELDLDGNVVNTVVDSRRKLIERSGPPEEAGRSLFDLDRDPEERANRIAEDPDAAERLGAVLDGIRGEMDRGVFLDIVNEGGAGAAHVFEGSLTIEPAVFRRIELSDLEPEDHATLSEDGTSVDFSVQLVNRRDPILRQPVLVTDRDRIRLVPSEPGATIRLTASLDGQALPPQERVLDGEAMPSDAADCGPCCRLYEVRGPSLESAVIDSTLEERLRGLGYVK